MKVRFRALLIALVILVVIDVVLRVPGLTLPIPDVYRLPSRTVLGYDQLISSMSRAGQPSRRGCRRLDRVGRAADAGADARLPT